MLILLVNDDWVMITSGLQCLQKQTCRWSSDESQDSFWFVSSSSKHFPISQFPAFKQKKPCTLLKVSKAGWISARIFPSATPSRGFLCGTVQTLMQRLATSDLQAGKRGIYGMLVSFLPHFSKGARNIAKKRVSQFSFPEFSSIFFWFLPYFRWFTYDTPLAIGRGKPAARWWNSTRFVFSSSATLRRLKPCWRSWKVERVDA